MYLNLIQSYYTKAQKYVLGMKDCLKHFLWHFGRVIGACLKLIILWISPLNSKLTELWNQTFLCKYISELNQPKLVFKSAQPSINKYWIYVRMSGGRKIIISDQPQISPKISSAQPDIFLLVLGSLIFDWKFNLTPKNTSKYKYYHFLLTLVCTTWNIKRLQNICDSKQP